jgi:hypothetical protein
VLHERGALEELISAEGPLSSDLLAVDLVRLQRPILALAARSFGLRALGA